MQLSSNAAATAALAVLAHAYTGPNFVVKPLSLIAHTDVSPKTHQLNFTVAAPGSNFQSGGPDPSQCRLHWPAKTIPTCYTTCAGGSGKYYARITPGTFVDDGHFSLDVYQAYTYEVANHNNGTIKVSADDKKAKYCCAHEGADILCKTRDTSVGFNGTLNGYFYDPVPAAGVC